MATRWDGTRSVDEAQQGLGRLLAPVAVAAAGGVVEDEEDVEITGIGHLGPAQTTHAHHAEGDVGGDVVQGRLQDDLGHVGEGRSRAGDVVDVEKVPGGDAQHLLLGEPDQTGPPPSFVTGPAQAFDGVRHQGPDAVGGQGPVVVEVGDQFGVAFDGLGHACGSTRESRHRRRAASGDSRKVVTTRAR